VSSLPVNEMPSTVKVQRTPRTVVLMTMALHAPELKGLDLNPLPGFGDTHHWLSITSTPKLRTQLNRLHLSRSLQLVKLQDSNDPAPTAPRRRLPTQPAASASSSRLHSNPAGRQLPPQVDHLPVKVERRQLALALHQSVLVPALKHRTQR
jgi:hypothetical protein